MAAKITIPADLSDEIQVRRLIASLIKAIEDLQKQIDDLNSV